MHEVFGQSEPARGGEVAERLIAPRAAVRMLHYRQELDVRETRLSQMIWEISGSLSIRHPSIIVFRGPLPRAEMHLVDRPWRVERIFSGTVSHPFLIVPGRFQIPDNWSCSGRKLPVERKRIALVHRASAM